MNKVIEPFLESVKPTEHRIPSKKVLIRQVQGLIFDPQHGIKPHEFEYICSQLNLTSVDVCPETDGDHLAEILSLFGRSHPDVGDPGGNDRAYMTLYTRRFATGGDIATLHGCYGFNDNLHEGFFAYFYNDPEFLESMKNCIQSFEQMMADPGAKAEYERTAKSKILTGPVHVDANKVPTVVLSADIQSVGQLECFLGQAQDAFVQDNIDQFKIILNEIKRLGHHGIAIGLVCGSQSQFRPTFIEAFERHYKLDGDRRFKTTLIYLVATLNQYGAFYEAGEITHLDQQLQIMTKDASTVPMIQWLLKKYSSNYESNFGLKMTQKATAYLILKFEGEGFANALITIMENIQCYYLNSEFESLKAEFEKLKVSQYEAAVYLMNKNETGLFEEDFKAMINKRYDNGTFDTFGDIPQPE